MSEFDGILDEQTLDLSFYRSQSEADKAFREIIKRQNSGRVAPRKLEPLRFGRMTPEEIDATVWGWTNCFFRALEGKGMKNNNVKNPKYYQIIDGLESIDIIARSMTDEQFKGFCLGNILKYRIRAGKKGDAAEDLAKANEYERIYESKKYLCIKEQNA